MKNKSLLLLPLLLLLFAFRKKASGGSSVEIPDLEPSVTPGADYLVKIARGSILFDINKNDVGDRATTTLYFDGFNTHEQPMWLKVKEQSTGKYYYIKAGSYMIVANK